MHFAPSTYIYIYTYTHTHTHTHTHVHMHMHMHIQIRIYKHTYTHIQVHTYAYTDAYIYMYQLNVHTHTCINCTSYIHIDTGIKTKKRDRMTPKFQLPPQQMCLTTSADLGAERKMDHRHKTIPQFQGVRFVFPANNQVPQNERRGLLNVCMCMHVHACTCVSECMDAHTCMSVCVHDVRSGLLKLCICIHVCVVACWYVNIYIHVNGMCVRVCKDAYKRLCVSVRIHTYIHRHTHSCMHTSIDNHLICSFVCVFVCVCVRARAFLFTCVCLYSHTT